MKQQMIVRLDDAAERMDIDKWQQFESLLDKYEIKPLVGVIPDCQDPKMEKYERDDGFWEKVHRWIDKGWTVALHGYQHVYDSNSGGVNPVKDVSEFAGHPFEVQAKKIQEGIRILDGYDIHPSIFFAPGHTFDENTIKAIKEETDIRIISDTIAWDSYKKDGMVYIPVQSGRVRNLPFKTITYCYHPNNTDEYFFKELDSFLKAKRDLFIARISILDTDRKYSFMDKWANRVYFAKRKIMK